MPDVTYCVPPDAFPNSDLDQILTDVKKVLHSPDAPSVKIPARRRLSVPLDPRANKLLSKLSANSIVIVDCADCRKPDGESSPVLPMRPYGLVSQVSNAMQQGYEQNSRVVFMGNTMRTSKNHALLFDTVGDRWAIRGDPSTILLSAVAGRPSTLLTTISIDGADVPRNLAADLLTGFAVACFPPVVDIKDFPWMSYYMLGRAVVSLLELRAHWPTPGAVITVGDQQGSTLLSFGADLLPWTADSFFDPLGLVAALFDAAQQKVDATEWSKNTCLSVLSHLHAKEGGQILWDSALVVEHVLAISGHDLATSSRLLSGNRILDAFLGASVDISQVWPCDMALTAVKVLKAAQSGSEAITPTGVVKMSVVAPVGASPYDHLAPSAMNAPKLFTYRRTIDGIRLWYGRSASSTIALDRIFAQKGRYSVHFTIHDGLVYCKQMSIADGLKAFGRAFRAFEVGVSGASARAEFEHVPPEKSEMHIFDCDWRAASKSLVHEMIAGGITGNVSSWLLLRLRAGDVKLRQMPTMPCYLKRSQADVAKDAGVELAAFLDPRAVSKLPMYFAHGSAWLDIANDRNLYRVERKGGLLDMTDEKFGEAHHNFNELKECSPVGNYGLL